MSSSGGVMSNNHHATMILDDRRNVNVDDHEVEQLLEEEFHGAASSQ